jgi:plastocyanin
LLPQGGATISSPAQVRSSGLVRILSAKPKAAPAPFTLTFTKPGIYHYLCAVHPGMRGVVVVLPSAKHVPSAASEATAAKRAVARAIADQRRLAKTKPSVPLQVFAGAGDRTGAEVTAFFPSQLSVKVGDTVDFVNHDQTDIHTVTFGPDPFRSMIEKGFVSPQGKQVLLNPLGALPSDPPGPLQYDGSNHGNGYLNSGILQPKGAPASLGPNAFSVTFTKAGVYHFECVVHAKMDGTIVVK